MTWLIALGDAQQRAGAGGHRDTLIDALGLATQLRDPERMAQAAWATTRGFYTTSHGVDAEHVAALERAVDVVGTETPRTRATLLALLAANLAFGNAARARQLSDAALKEARRAGDDVVLARVLSQRQFTIEEPATLEERLANTSELVELADRLGDPSLTVFSRWWRAVAALEAGDRREADTRVDEAQRLAEHLGEPFMRCATAMLAANRELAWGDLDRAGQQSERCLELSREADANDVDVIYWFQRFLIGRERENLDTVAAGMYGLCREFGDAPHWQAGLALERWEVGRHDEALEILEDHAASGFADAPPGVLWVHTLWMFAEVAAAARHETAAKALLDLLAPYAGHLAADPAACAGSIAHYLGMLATSLEDWPRAEAYLDQAAATHERIGAIRWHNRTRLAHARLLLARDQPGDQRTASVLLRDTTDRARHAGQPTLAHACQRLDPQIRRSTAKPQP